MFRTLFYGALIAYGFIVALLLVGYALRAHHLTPPRAAHVLTHYQEPRS